LATDERTETTLRDADLQAEFGVMENSFHALTRRFLGRLLITEL
jgi:hypothetical protein